MERKVLEEAINRFTWDMTRWTLGDVEVPNGSLLMSRWPHRAGWVNLHLRGGRPKRGQLHRRDRASSSPVNQPLIDVSKKRTCAMISETSKLVTC
jgi:hypothetical protein